MNDLRARHDQVMGLHAPMFYEEPIQLVSGDGVWLESADGNRYLDLYNNVPCVGHGNPRVAKAIGTQAATLNVHSRYLHESVIDYVERLVGLHCDAIESAILACSGTEAVEMALTMSRTVTGNHGIICTDATYHGNTSLVGLTRRLPVGEERGGVRSISTPDMFRPIEAGLSEQELTARYLEQLGETIAAFDASGEGVAAIILCSILANEGLTNAPAGWFTEATAMVRDAGGVVIADEVQAGFARSGQWWGYDTMGFVPDIVCMGKPMGNGLPVSAVAASRDAISTFRERHRYFNTFAASPIQAAAGMAVIDEIVDRDLVNQVADVGVSLRKSLGELQQGDPRMGDVRGHGMFIGIDWVHPGTTDHDPEGAAAMVEALKQRNMLVGRAGQHFNVLKVRPPLVFEQEHADLFLEAFASAAAETR